MQGTEHDKRRAKLKKIKCPICGMYIECEDRWDRPSGYDPESEKHYECESCGVKVTVNY